MQTKCYMSRVSARIASQSPKALSSGPKLFSSAVSSDSTRLARMRDR